MREEGIEDLIARSRCPLIRNVFEIAKLRELLDKPERAGSDACFDSGDLITRPSQVCFGRGSRQSGAIPHTLEPELELDSSFALGGYAASDGSSAHVHSPG